MSGRMTRMGYQTLINENITWLMAQPRTLERDHIKLVLDRAVDCEYGRSHPMPTATPPLDPAAAPRDAEAVKEPLRPGSILTSCANVSSTVVESRWRVGRKVGRTIYLDGHLFGVIDTAEAATMAVDALNGAAEVEALRSQLADKTRQLTELSTADGTDRWVAGKELEMIEALRGQVVEGERLLRAAVTHIKAFATSTVRNGNGPSSWSATIAFLSNYPVEAFLSRTSTSTRAHNEDMAERAARAASERNRESLAGGAPLLTPRRCLTCGHFNNEGEGFLKFNGCGAYGRIHNFEASVTTPEPTKGT